jgi:hypothetical protein
VRGRHCEPGEAIHCQIYRYSHAIASPALGSRVRNDAIPSRISGEEAISFVNLHDLKRFFRNILSINPIF